MTDRWRVLLIGDYDREEFSSAVRWVMERADVESVSDFSEGLETLQGRQRNGAEPPLWVPDLIVAFQLRPGEWSTAEWEALQKHAPLARMVALLGSQCEGEPRSGKPWPGLTRIYWYDWRARFEREFLACSPPRWEDWERPRTVTEVDAELHRAQLAKSRETGKKALSETQRPLVAIHAAHYSTREGLIEACHSLGYQAIGCYPAPNDRKAFEFDINIRQEKISDFQVLIWDGDSLDESAWSDLAAVCRHAAPAKVIALLGFPRIQDQQRVASAGASVVIAKPFQLDDLCWHLDAFMEPKTLLRRWA